MWKDSALPSPSTYQRLKANSYQNMRDTLTDKERYPLMTEQGGEMLKRLLEHPYAPRFNWTLGDRLTRERLAEVRAYEVELRGANIGWRAGETPGWLREFVVRCYETAPFYRAYGDVPREFTDIPVTTRSDLARAPEKFVPDDLPLDDLIFYGSTGTTGHHIHAPSHPVSAAKYIPLLRAALATRGVTMDGGSGRVAMANVGYQERTATYAAVMSQLDFSGVVKINLNPKEWNGEGAREYFLNDLKPEIITGDPLSFAELMKMNLTFQPKALISTAMTLLPGLARALEERFGCPVLDVYCSSEAGPMAVRVGDAFHLLQHRLYVEILDEAGEPCVGKRGEITLSGGMNPYFPLLRYRTSDYARLEFEGNQPRLVDFQGRAPLVFYTVNGASINNNDVTVAMRDFPLWQYTVHQAADGALTVRVRNPGVPLEQIRARLLRLFGADQKLEIVQVDSFGAQDKVVQYTSEMSHA